MSARLVNIVELTCDAKGCGWTESLTADNAREARRIIRGADYGWKRRRVAGELLDLCPEHSDALPSKIMGVEDLFSDLFKTKGEQA